MDWFSLLNAGECDMIFSDLLNLVFYFWGNVEIEQRLYNEGIENMKRKVKQLIPMILLIIVLGYLFLTPIGALRLVVAIYGYPVSAITLKISDTPYSLPIESNQKIYTLINPPREEATDSDLKNWTVTRYGIFYIGSYHGWA